MASNSLWLKSFAILKKKKTYNLKNKFYQMTLYSITDKLAYDRNLPL